VQERQKNKRMNMDIHLDRDPDYDCLSLCVDGVELMAYVRGPTGAKGCRGIPGMRGASGSYSCCDAVKYMGCTGPVGEHPVRVFCDAHGTICVLTSDNRTIQSVPPPAPPPRPPSGRQPVTPATPAPAAATATAAAPAAPMAAPVAPPTGPPGVLPRKLFISGNELILTSGTESHLLALPPLRKCIRVVPSLADVPASAYKLKC
jgi:hypothetical protein